MKGRKKIVIDRDKVRAEVRKLDGTGRRVWLDRAIDMLPDDAFPDLIADYVRLKDVLGDKVARVADHEPCSVGMLDHTRFAVFEDDWNVRFETHDVTLADIAYVRSSSSYLSAIHKPRGRYPVARSIA